MEEIKAGLSRLFNTDGYACVPLPAPGTAGMEAAIMNLLEPGDRAVIAINGAFGGRMADMADRAGAEVIEVELESGPARRSRQGGSRHGRRSGEGSGLRPRRDLDRRQEQRRGAVRHRPQARRPVGGGLRHLARRHPGRRRGLGRRRHLFRHPEMPLGATPGLSPICLSKRAQDAISGRKTKVRNWLLDFNLLMAYWGGEGGRTYHHTAPIQRIVWAA